MISGAGLVTPLGLTRETTWAAILAGQCGLREMSAIEQPLPPGATGGQAPDETACDGSASGLKGGPAIRATMDVTANPSRRPGETSAFTDTLAFTNAATSREVMYLRRAIDEALAHAGIVPASTYAPSRCGFMLGTTLHGMRAAGRFLRSDDPAMLARFLAGGTLEQATAGLPFTGFSATTCSACSSSLGSIALGASLLQSGQLDLVIAGGYDTISEYVYGGFNSLRLVAPGPLRPFSRGRQGMKLAEGFGIVALERADDARRRGNRPLARIAGFGESADAHHLTQPHPAGEGAARAINAALDCAGMSAAQIDLIAAHATGTPDNDAAEYAALSRVFGPTLSASAVIAFKSHLGHTLGGAGAVELILSALCLRDQVIPACANITADDLEFAGLGVSVGAARRAPVRATLNTSLGFGGANTSMVLVRAEDARLSPLESAGSNRANETTFSARFAHPAPVYITGVGVVLPGMIGNEAFVSGMSGVQARCITADTGPIPEADYVDLLNARRVRRMSDYVKLSLAATMLACRDGQIADIPQFAATCSALLGSTHGSANYSEAYYRQIVNEGVLAANPMLFAEGVPNAAAAHLSLMLSLKGPCQTVIGTRTAGLDALHLAATRIALGQCDRAIVSAAEEFSPLVNSAYAHWGLHSPGGPPAAPFSGDAGGFVAGCGAVTLIVESARSVAERGVTPRGRLLQSTGPLAFPAVRHREIASLFMEVSQIISSANGTWIDRLESIAISTGNQSAPVASLAGRVAETFSVMPLAAIALELLAPSGDRSNRRFSVVCSDYSRLVSAAGVEFR